ncbi:apoptosis-stimulating of p53 protein 1 isoform X2 [Sitophilus oryzae]|uniref:Apoptosis-stimulating of p53 protein 1 isoform X2 n=2 Tax=Sitophilus oryzae TaxID=7048 RepID=A0A6J2YCG6_SITOR|nr:apoptosis-stimulating of p53 protein 1 isoform X2 [Sitophilus oryzae]
MMIISVWNYGAKTEVPVTPETTVADIIECCRDPSEEICNLVCPENKDEPFKDTDRPLEILKRWGSGRLVLRYTTLSSNGGTYENRNGMKEPEHFSETLPDGVQLTLTELREMACRQQAQIDSQHQLLAAKEQRLRYLKEQDARAQRVQAESERLRRLRDRVEAQELKLRKLRALRGQVDHQKQNNISLTSDLDSIRALFNEKEKELSLAVAKVEELTRQLEELRRGRTNRDPPPASALELDKLRRELMYRNKLNEQQNQRLNQQREALTARQEEMSAIDKRISELQERLQRKRHLNQQLASQISAASHKAAYQQFVRLTGNGDQNNQAFARKEPQTGNVPPNGLLRSNIAAVEPYNHVPLQSNQQIRNINQNQEHSPYHPSYQQNQHIKPETNPNINDIQEITKKIANIYTRGDEENHQDFAVSKSDPKYQTLPYNTKFTVNLLPNNNKIIKNDLNSNEKEDTNYPSNIVNTNNIVQAAHMTVHSAPLSQVNKNIATPLNQHDLLSRKNSEGKEQNNIFSNENRDDLAHKYQNDHTYLTGNINSTTSTTTYQKPISSVAPTSIHHTSIPSTVYQTSSIKVQPVEPQTIAATTKTPTALSYGTQVQSPPGAVLSPPQSSSTPLGTPEVSIDTTPKPALPPKPAIKPPPRQTQMVSEETSLRPPPLPLSEPPEEKSSPLLGVKPPPLLPSQKPNIDVSNKNFLASQSEMIIKAKPLNIKKQQLSEQPKLRSQNAYAKFNGLILNNRRIELPPVYQFPEMSVSSADKSESQNTANSQDKDPSMKDEIDRISRTSTDDTSSIDSKEQKEDNVIRRIKKGNLKQTGKSNLSRRVSFDPLALLLDASLEGELELVKKTASQVPNPSAANDEGITALHNAICAGHIEIVKFLVEFGCDVNAQDSDGWTPLHCAASCNNLTMVKFLVEHGACIFATTLSDHETAAEKCEEDEEGFDGCSEYLYSVQEKLGILNGGTVYAVFDYNAQQPDELTFKAGQQFTVLRKGDENEREWWWSKLGDKEGYVPRNLLGLYPRVQRNEDN